MSKYKIKIISGWTKPGGSTVALINLCNLFNERGLDCTFYGPHDWFLSRCKWASNDLPPIDQENEILIVHFLDLQIRPEKSHKVILASHEKSVFKIGDIKNKFWDTVVYVSKSQMEWQDVPGVVIPNVLTPLKKVTLSSVKKAGVIGSVDPNKNTHVSIDRALHDGFDIVYLYGIITNESYYKEHVQEYVKSGKAVLLGHEDDIQTMYNALTDVYHSSLVETFNLVKAECELTGVNYHGLPSSDPGAVYKPNDEIFAMWKDVLDI